MAPLNSGSSTYHRIQAIYWRKQDASTSCPALVAVEGNYATKLQQHWSSIFHIISESASFNTSNTQICTTQTRQRCLGFLDGSCSTRRQHWLKIKEVADHEHDLVLGMAICDDQIATAGSFEDWLEGFFLRQTRFQPFEVSNAGATLDCVNEDRLTAEKIAGIFDKMLRNTPNGDQWSTGHGSNYFINRVQGFVAAAKPVEFVLPAFPCKSSNRDKVGGDRPDLGESLALETLENFVLEISKIYSPGALLWVVSDGHVFSDCIGVNDSTVTLYDDELKQISHRRDLARGRNHCIRFVGLEELLFGEPQLFATFDKQWTDATDLEHAIDTNRTSSAELSRKVLMAACTIDRSNLRTLITSQDESTLRLYRGHSRFMFEDLSDGAFLSLSASKRRKLASSVAMEMIMRNQAYSNLVELLFPNYVRLSIHAHSNTGPKFGITLFPKQKLRAITSLDDLSTPKPTFDFQIPTPWHNSIMKIDHDDTIYLGKTKIFHEAIKSGRFQGEWVETSDGGYFRLASVAQTPVRSTGGDLELMRACTDTAQIQLRLASNAATTAVPSWIHNVSTG